MNKRLIATAIFGLILITALASFFIVNQVDNDTWDDTHWGGDVGEEEYNEPIENEGTKGDGEVCSMIVVIGFVGGSGYFVHWKRKNE